MIYKVLFMFCFIIQSIQGYRDKVTVQVYYETYDFDSRLLIATELTQALDLLATEYVQVEMYAYGLATTEKVDGKYMVTCDNGPEECVGNKFDACAVDTLDIHSAMALINCVIDPSNGLDGEYQFPTYLECGHLLDIDTTQIYNCSVSERGDELLKRNGEATSHVHLIQMPYVLIDGEEWRTDDNVSLFVALCDAICDIGFIKPRHCF